VNPKIHVKSLSVCVSVLATGFLALAQTTSPTCSNATLTGTYGLNYNARAISSPASLSKIQLGMGTATFDGAGNFTFDLTSNTASMQGIGQIMAGTYSLPANCLGTLNITTGDTASFTLIPYNSGNDFSLLGLDPTYVITVTGAPHPAACVTATLSGAYAFNGSGYSLSSGSITGVNAITGLLQFDGAGNVTGNWSLSANGATTSSNVSGKYTIAAPACVGSGTLTDANGLSYALSFTETTSNATGFSATMASSTNTLTLNGHSSFTYPGLAVELISGNDLTVPAGSLFSIYGFNLSTGGLKTFNGKFPLPPTLSNATVTVNGETAPIYSADSTALGTEGLINAQMPLDIQPPVATLVVTNGMVSSNAVAINIPASANPAVLVYGNNHALAQNVPGFATNSDVAPASAGQVVAVYLTGAGPVTGQNLLTTGAATPSSPLFHVSESFSATISGVNATVQNIELVPTSVGGFYQANIVIPSGVATGDRALVINIGGKNSNSTLLSIK
jgi:uncharacterized protein (TIGR03437 family)